MKVLNKAEDNDLIILSDVDVMFGFFVLYTSVYFNNCIGLFNLFLNLEENNWHGSKLCLKKNLKSPQWLRNLKFKKYPFGGLINQKIYKLFKMVDGTLLIYKSQKIFQKD